ncbi:MAG TPA: hypothetical protein VK835_12410 [Bacteroidia bacterium]|jgi:hypothetical protein|nr:hypothetical protein [Bacteroidia bacterium]
MKNFFSRTLLLISLLIIGKLGFAQGDTLRFDRYKDFVNSVTHVFKDNHPELSFFKFRVFPSNSPINIYDLFKGNGTDSAINFSDYLSLVNLLEISNYNEEGNVNLDSLTNNLITSKLNKPSVTPISLSFIEYSSFDDTIVDKEILGFSNGQFAETIIPGYYPFKKGKLFASSALNEVFQSSPINFMLNDTFILSNIADRIDSIYIDFADGNGFVPIIKGINYPVSYDTDGQKKIKVALSAYGQQYISSFTIIDSSHVFIASRNSAYRDRK